MARIEGIDLPRNKRVEIGLTYLYGIGLTRSHQILEATKINPDTRIKDLSEAEVAALREYITQNFVLEGDLRRQEQWAAHPHELTHPQRPQEDCGRSRSPSRYQEVISKKV